MFTLPLVFALASTFSFVPANLTRADADDHGFQVVALSDDPPQDAPAVGRGQGRGRQPAARGRGAGDSEDDRQIKVFHLKHADCRDFAAIPGAMFAGMPIQIDRGTNTLIVNATRDQIEKLESLIESLDRPATTGDMDSTTVVPIEHRNPEEIAGQLKALFVGTGLRIGADEARSSILLSGPATYAAKAQDVIRTLDTEARVARLEFAFFKATLGAAEGQVDEVVPDDLEEVAQELRRFGKIELLGRLHTLATESERFEISGLVASQAFTRIRGRVLPGSGSGFCKLSMSADLSMSRSTPSDNEEEDKAEPKRRGPTPEFQLETVVTTKQGDYVVLGSAPSGWSKGESVILVLQVLP